MKAVAARLLTILASLLVTGCDEPEQSRAAGPSAEQVEVAITAATRHLVAMIQDDGRFIYRANLDPSVRVPETYNLVRHAGTIYAIAGALQRSPDPRALEKLRRAAGFLRLQMYPQPEAGEGIFAVVSDPIVTGRDRLTKAKLGGSALALAGLLRVESLAPGTTPEHELRGLGEFLLFMQEPDGGFHDHYLPGLDRTWSPIDSLYYPGEAALALTMLHERTGDARYLDAAKKALMYLGRTRADWPLERIPADHWALLATEAVLPQVTDPAEREVILDHARRVVRSILSNQLLEDRYGKAVGAFDEHGHTTPTATRMEGLLAALGFLPPTDADLRRDVLTSVKHGLAFLMNAQVRTGAWAGTMPRTMGPSKAVGPRATEIRIDYTQHFLSALMQYEQVVLGEAAATTENDR